MLNNSAMLSQYTLKTISYGKNRLQISTLHWNSDDRIIQGCAKKNRSLVRKIANISQSNEETHLGCVGIFSDAYYKFIAESRGERILKICQHLAKLRTTVQ